MISLMSLLVLLSGFLFVFTVSIIYITLKFNEFKNTTYYLLYN